MNQLKLGRAPRKFDPRVPHRSSMVLMPGAILTPAPVEVHWAQGLSDLGMMLNDVEGDCSIAFLYHALQVWTANASGSMQTEPDSNVQLLYELACGYDPKKSGEGPGGVIQDVLTYALNNGMPVGAGGQQRHKIDAFFEIDPRALMDVQYEINACGLVDIGFNVPEFLLAEGPPLVWDDYYPNDKIVGGHCVGLSGFDFNASDVISWGRTDYKMTWKFFQRYVDEAYGIIDKDWVMKNGTTPAGLTLPQLLGQMRALKN